MKTDYNKNRIRIAAVKRRKKIRQLLSINPQEPQILDETLAYYLAVAG